MLDERSVKAGEQETVARADGRDGRAIRPAEGRDGRAIRPAEGQNRPVDLARIAWLGTVVACLIAVVILLFQGYYGYAGVTFAVAVAAAINLT